MAALLHTARRSAVAVTVGRGCTGASVAAPSSTASAAPALRRRSALPIAAPAFHAHSIRRATVAAPCSVRGLSSCSVNGGRLGTQSARHCSTRADAKSEGPSAAAAGAATLGTGRGNSYDGSGWRFGGRTGPHSSTAMPSSSGRTLLALLGGAGVATFLWSQARMDNEPGALAPLPLSTRNGSDYAAVTAAAATAAAASAAAATEDPLADHKLPPLIKEHRKLPFWRRMWFYIRIISRGVLLASIWVPALSLGIVLPTGTWVRLLVRLLERCGAVFIKLGQWAATRPDLFPEEACEQFAQLQASVKPHPFEQSVKACVDNFGPHLRAPDGSTLEIMPRVLGSGSMGQVHHGYITTPDGAVRTEVAIKVLHPGIHSLVNLDLTLLYFVARGITMIPYAELQWLSVPEMLVQFTEFMSSHLDLISEAHNMSRFRKNFEENPSIYFPRAMAPFIGPQVLVQELAHGLPLGKFLHSESFAAKRAEENAELRGKNLSIRERIARQRKKEEEQPGSGDGDGSAAASPALAHPGTSPLHTELARLGLQMYLHMLIEDNFVHSDLHPGNLLVQFPNYPLVGEQQDPAALAKESPAQLSSEHVRLVVLDSGLVSALSRRNRENFLSLFGALILRDGRLAARLMLDNAPRAACTDPQQLQDDMHVIVSAIPLESLASVDLGRLLSEVMNCVRKHHVKLESDFASIIISLAIIEGIGRQLDPNLSLFHQAVPVMLKNKDCRSILLRTAGWKACAKLGLNILKDEIHLAHDHPHHPHAQHHPPPH